MIFVGNNAMVFIETDESYYEGIYILNGDLERIGRTLVDHYDYDKTFDLIYEKRALRTIENNVEKSKKYILSNECDYFIAALHSDALKNRECFRYGNNHQLLGESVDETFIPYTSYYAKYVYFINHNNQWLVSYEESGYEFEDLVTNIEMLEI